MPSTHILIIGAGGHAVSVAEIVLASGLDLVGFVSPTPEVDSLLDRPVHDSIPDAYREGGGQFVIAVGDNSTRQQMWADLTATLSPTRFPFLVHPSASVSALARIGPSSVVHQGTIVGSAAIIGTGCLLNSGSILDHESVMEDFSSLAPGATTGGRVRIGRRAAISIGATVKPGVLVGADTVVGSASYVHEDVPPNVVAYGTPARVVRQRKATDPYLS